MRSADECICNWLAGDLLMVALERDPITGDYVVGKGDSEAVVFDDIHSQVEEQETEGKYSE